MRNNKPIPTPAMIRQAIIVLNLSQEARDTLDHLDIEDEREVDTIGKLLEVGVVKADTSMRLITKLQEAGAEPSRCVLEDLAKAVRSDPLGHAALVFGNGA